MAAATDQQVQNYVNERVRPFAEAVRSLKIVADSDKASIDDIYAALTQPTPTWTDNRTDGPPHLLTPADVLAWNAFVTDLQAFLAGHGAWPTVLKCCVRPPAFQGLS